MPLTLFQILALLRGRPSDAKTILSSLGERIGRAGTCSVPVFYRYLNRGIDEGWIRVEGTGKGGGRGRPRQLYELTREGAAAMQEEAVRLDQFTRLALGGPNDSKMP